MKIQEYNQELERTRVCNGCPMLGRGAFVGADSATGLAEPVKILFLGLNPGTEEARQGLPFVGPSGQFLRRQLRLAEIDSWAMANSLLCSSPNESAIVNANAARAACRANVGRIFLTFRPVVIAPCGNGAWSVFKVAMPITRAADNFFISRGPEGKGVPTFILPMFHPSALIRSGGENSAKYPQFIRRLKSIGAIGEQAAAHGVEKTAALLAEKGIATGCCFEKNA